MAYQLLNLMDEYDLTAVDLCYCFSINFTRENANGSVK